MLSKTLSHFGSLIVKLKNFRVGCGRHNLGCHMHAFAYKYNFIGIIWRALVCLMLIYVLLTLFGFVFCCINAYMYK